MFDELKIKHNGDDTYSMIVKNFLEEKTGKKFDVTVQNLKEFELNINQNTEYDDRYIFELGLIPKFERNMYLSINSKIMPDKNNKLLEMKQKRTKKEDIKQ